MKLAEGDKDNQPLFQPIGSAVDIIDEDRPEEVRNELSAADEAERVVDEIESLCMNCHENGFTRLFLTQIPYFREVILSSFACPHCHFKNSEIQSAGEIQPQGCRISFELRTIEDASRQVVKSDSATVKFKELDIEIPPGRGVLSTVEGLLRTTIDDLEFRQEARKLTEPEVFTKIEGLITEGRLLLEAKKPWTLIVDDPSGHSFIERKPDDGFRWRKDNYNRTKEQNDELLGGEGENEKTQPRMDEFESEIVPDEVYTFPDLCPGCQRPCNTNMKMVEIPHFKEVVIMSTSCDICGYRSNEVRTGGAVPSLGRRITVKVDDAEDMKRDILKSETCAMMSPELALEVQPGTLGGRFTTLEGLLTQIRDDLKRSALLDIGSEAGDSDAGENMSEWRKFFVRMDEAIEGKIPFTITLEDPMASSYVQNLNAPNKDPKIEIEDYERTAEEEEELGLKDMQTEGYDGEAEAAAASAKADTKAAADVKATADAKALAGADTKAEADAPAQPTTDAEKPL